MNAWKLSLIAVAGALVVAAACAVPILEATRRPAVTRRDTLCPTPDQRAMSGPAMSRDDVLDRLRAVRARLRGDDGAGAVLPEGAAADADEMLFRLIVEFDLATTPLMEPSNP